MVFGHKIVFDEVIRQDELDFIKAINDVSKGEIPEDTKNLILRLQRPLSPGDDPIRPCGRNFDCDIFNACKLMEMDGVSKCYQSIDEDVNKLCSKMCVPKLLHLKIGCPVMLVKNISSALVNGLQGKVVAMKEDSVTVDFENDLVQLGRETFTVYSSIDKKIVATRHQIPLILSFSITIHKAQGLTLDRVEVDASNIFAPGQLGVAMGRARNKKGQGLSVSIPTLIPQRSSIYEFYNKNFVQFDSSLECCRHSVSLLEKLNLDFDYETGSDSDNSDFNDGEILEVDEMLPIGEDMPASSSDLECRLTTVGSDILEHHVDHTKMKQLIPDNAIIPEQMRLKVTLTDIFKKPTKELNTFFGLLYQKIQSIFDKVCGKIEVRKPDSKTWTEYNSEIYQFSVSQECIQILEHFLNSVPNNDTFFCIWKDFRQNL
ncbi:hypothetical protein ACJMK2_015836 [Sinanodonta woodiana]|uniref:DNA helicase Pif1-like 2B domain-containing protein n=1 Tax=Sinanodonta woodiana TaxID=1069815 RepID=A0ABD3UUI1_SINWO